MVRLKMNNSGSDLGIRQLVENSGLTFEVMLKNSKERGVKEGQYNPPPPYCLNYSLLDFSK